MLQETSLSFSKLPIERPFERHLLLSATWASKPVCSQEGQASPVKHQKEHASASA